jgi:hypothetical protein
MTRHSETTGNCFDCRHCEGDMTCTVKKEGGKCKSYSAWAPIMKNKGYYSTAFFSKAKNIHGDKYDYSKSVYVTAHTKVEIICRKHGSFFQAPLNHIDKKKGCRLCYLERMRERYKKPVVEKKMFPKYKRNKSERNYQRDTHNRKILLWAKKYKLIQELGGSCKCGVSSIGILCFHHISKDKESTLSDLNSRKIRFNDLLKEALKCQLLCHNCHREEHFDRDAQSFLNKKLCLEYKKQFDCEICGYSRCLDSLEFHHKYDDKKFKISRLIIYKKWKTIYDFDEKIKDELDKCRVLCRNCHQIEHTAIAFLIANEKEIIRKSETLKDKNFINIEDVILLNNQGLDKFEISKKLNCSSGRIYEILKAIKG